MSRPKSGGIEVSHPSPGSGEQTLRFVFDYVDPGSYLAAALLRRFLSVRGIEPRMAWVPLELRPPGQGHLDPDSAEWTALVGAVAVAAADAGIPFRAPTFVPWSRKAHELALLAAEKGCFESVHETLFEAHFVHGLDIGRVDVLTDLGGKCGLSPSEVRTVLGVDRFGPEIKEVRADLLREGIRGIPLLQSHGMSLAGFTSTEGLLTFFESSLKLAPGER